VAVHALLGQERQDRGADVSAPGPAAAAEEGVAAASAPAAAPERVAPVPAPGEHVHPVVATALLAPPRRDRLCVGHRILLFVFSMTIACHHDISYCIAVKFLGVATVPANWHSRRMPI